MGKRLSSLSFVVSLVAGGTACSPSRRSECTKDLASSRVAEAAEAARAPAVSPTLPSPGRDPFFRGIELLAWPLDLNVKSRFVLGPAPRVMQNDEAATQIRRVARESGRRDVATIFVFGAFLRVPIPPSQLADEILDARLEQEALGAERLVDLTTAAERATTTRRFRATLSRRGEGPFKYDFVWDFTAQRLDRADGSILLRYEQVPSPEQLHMTVFRGTAALVPDGDGTLWTEALAVGSDVTAPFFLAGKVESAVGALLTGRWTRMADASRSSGSSGPSGR